MCREAEGRPCSEVVNSRVEDGCVLTREGEVLRADLRVRAGEGEHALGQHVLLGSQTAHTVCSASAAEFLFR